MGLAPSSGTQVPDPAGQSQTVWEAAEREPEVLVGPVQLGVTPAADPLLRWALLGSRDFLEERLLHVTTLPLILVINTLALALSAAATAAKLQPVRV